MIDPSSAANSSRLIGCMYRLWPEMCMVGRHVLIARGRDATIATTFGPNTLTGFRVWTGEVADA